MFRYEGIEFALFISEDVWNFKLEKLMFHESMFGPGLCVEDFLPVLSVIAFGYIVSCLAFVFLN